MGAGETTLDETVEALTGRFASGFPERAPALRTVGREAEFPVVTPEGRAGDVSRLWPLLLERGGCEPVWDTATDGSRLLTGVEAGGWSCVIEVGRGTVELSVGPRPTLHDLAREMERALGVLGEVVREVGYRLLGLGIQPRTPPTPNLLTPKLRYQALLRAIGPQWLEFCVTAGDQVQVDMGLDDLVPNMNLMNATSGAVIALTANSSVYGGRAGRYASGREGLTREMVGEPYRHGASARPYADLGEYVRFLTGLRCLCLPDGEGGFRPVGVPFAEHLRREPAEGGIGDAYERFLFHEHYVWPSARPRARIGTLEVRPACQQPGASSWVPSALALGLIEAADEVLDYLRGDLGDRYWEVLLRYRRMAVLRGLEAPEPVPGFLATLLRLAGEGLRRRGRGEEVFLAPAHDVLDRREGPADRARSLLERGGVELLVERAALA